MTILQGMLLVILIETGEEIGDTTGDATGDTTGETEVRSCFSRVCVRVGVTAESENQQGRQAEQPAASDFSRTPADFSTDRQTLCLLCRR